MISIFTKLIIWGILFWFIIPDFALADNIRPAYLEIEELASGNIRVVWKVPRGQGIPQQFEPPSQSNSELYRLENG